MSQTNIPALEGINLPLFALRAALTFASDEATRHYLNGIYIHAIGDEYRIVATDGHRLFVYSTPVESERHGADLPEWATAGVIIPREGLSARLSLLAKLECETARIAYQVDAPQLVISDTAESCTFKMQPVDEKFADYQRVLDNMKSFEARDLAEMSSTAYSAEYLKDAGALAKLLGASAVRVFGAAADEPSLITFPECPFAMLVLMPKRHGEALGAGVAKVLSVAVNGTISALKAHRTRWADKLTAAKAMKRPTNEIAEKIADFDNRIAAFITNAGGVPALPAPTSEEASSYAINGAITSEADFAEMETVNELAA